MSSAPEFRRVVGLCAVLTIAVGVVLAVPMLFGVTGSVSSGAGLGLFGGLGGAALWSRRRRG